MKNRIIIAISTLALMAQYSCNKCYNCSNSCCIKQSTSEMICSTDFATPQQYWNAIDSLQGDLQCSYLSILKEACSEEEKEYLEQNERLGCMKKRKN